jgi:CRP/FNR family transcriptional regulator, cyclic AMP receptor protein
VRAGLAIINRGRWRADRDSVVARKSKSKFDPEAFLARADGGLTVSKYAKGQAVFAQGEPADSVFYIREGRVKISVVSAQGKEAVGAFLKAGDFIGEGCLKGLESSDLNACRQFTR